MFLITIWILFFLQICHGTVIMSLLLAKPIKPLIFFGVLSNVQTQFWYTEKKVLYLHIVRSCLLYCSPLWRPHQVQHIILLERVQRRASKFILNDYSTDYKSQLIKLNLLPLMYIYELMDILFFIKSLKASNIIVLILQNNYLSLSPPQILDLSV